MVRFVVRPPLFLFPILLGLSILIFAWIRVLPGSPAESLLGERATPALVQAYKQKYGLDRPVPLQYLDYLRTTVSGDLGTSIASHRSVLSEFADRFPATIELTA